MYLSFYGLAEKPFSITPDPRYLYLGGRHAEALAHLVYGISEAGGFIQLTGEVGTGKTTIIRSLLARQPDNTEIALILNPRMNAPEFVLTLCEELGILLPDDAVGSVKELVDILNRYLLKAHAQGKRVVLIVDEAQNLTPEVLEQVRLLTNLETETQKLLQIILIGQPELREVLARNDLRQLAQRITGRYHLDPLSRDESSRLREAPPAHRRRHHRDLHRRRAGRDVSRQRRRAAAAERDRRSRTAGRLLRGPSRHHALVGAQGRRRGVRAPADAGLAALGAGSRHHRGRGRRGAGRMAAGAAAGTRAGGRARDGCARSGSSLPAAPGGRARRSHAAGSRGTSHRCCAVPPPSPTSTGPTRGCSRCGPRATSPAPRTPVRRRCGRDWNASTRPAAWTRCAASTARPCSRSRTIPAPSTRPSSSGSTPIAPSCCWVRDRHEVPLAELQARWNGEFQMLWRPPQLDTRSLSLGMSGDPVRELRTRLMQWAGLPAGAVQSDIFDESLRELVIQFQRRAGLTADGVAGTRTQAMLDAALAAADSPLLSAVSH